MKVVGADKGKMDVIQMDPEEGAAALVSGDVVMACLLVVTLSKQQQQLDQDF